MSNTVLKSMQRVTEKIAHYEERLKEPDLSAKKRRYFKQELGFKLKRLRHLSKLYIWGIR